jgi:pimeloyl-ACP methyl ester carboxylesterase
MSVPSTPPTQEGSPAPARWFPVDDSRGRRVPVAVYEAAPGVPRHPRLVLLSHGFGVLNTEYGFLGRALAGAGYQVLSVQHQLPSDPPPPRDDRRSEYLKEMLREGVLNLRFVFAAAARHWPWADHGSVILIGHSFGGDLSAVLANDSPELVADLITLDHPRVPLPRASRPRQLSLRAGERRPERGVLPTSEEQRRFGIKVVKLARARHMDFTDLGPEEIRREVVEQVLKQLNRPPPE